MPRRGSGFPPNVNRKSAGVPKGVVTILELDNGRIYTSLYMQICKRTWYFSPGEISELDVEDKDALIAGFLQRQQVNAVQQALLTHTSPYYRVATYALCSAWEQYNEEGAFGAEQVKSYLDGFRADQVQADVFYVGLRRCGGNKKQVSAVYKPIGASKASVASFSVDDPIGEQVNQVSNWRADMNAHGLTFNGTHKDWFVYLKNSYPILKEGKPYWILWREKKRGETHPYQRLFKWRLASATNVLESDPRFQLLWKDMLPTKDDGKVEVDCYLTGYPLLRCERDPEWWDAMTDKDLRKAVGATDISFDHIYTQAAVERILERDTPPNLRLTSWTLNRMKQSYPPCVLYLVFLLIHLDSEPYPSWKVRTRLARLLNVVQKGWSMPFSHSARDSMKWSTWAGTVAYDHYVMEKLGMEFHTPIPDVRSFCKVDGPAPSVALAKEPYGWKGTPSIYRSERMLRISSMLHTKYSQLGLVYGKVNGLISLEGPHPDPGSALRVWRACRATAEYLFKNIRDGKTIRERIFTDEFEVYADLIHMDAHRRLQRGESGQCDESGQVWVCDSAIRTLMMDLSIQRGPLLMSTARADHTKPHTNGYRLVNEPLAPLTDLMLANEWKAERSNLRPSVFITNAAEGLDSEDDPKQIANLRRMIAHLFNTKPGAQWLLKESLSAEESSVLETMFTWLRQAGKGDELDEEGELDTYEIEDEEEEEQIADSGVEEAEYDQPDGESESVSGD